MFVPFIIYDANALDFPYYPEGYSRFEYNPDDTLRFYQYFGFDDGQLYDVINIAITSNDNVYILKQSGHIQAFTPNMTFLHSWDSSQTEDNLSYYRYGIAIDSNDNIYVADGGNSRIQAFSSNGTFLHKWGSSGTEDGQFQKAHGIAIDNNDIIYVADSGNSRIQAFTTDGTFLHKWGSKGAADHQFQVPSFITTDSKNNVYVVDPSNRRIQVFTSNGTFLNTWGSGGIADDLIGSPISVAIDSDDNVYVLEGKIVFVIKMFSSDGTLLNAWTSSPGLINWPNSPYSGSCPDLDTRQLCVMLYDNNRLTGSVIGSRAATALTTDNNDNIYLLNRVESSVEIIKSQIHHSVTTPYNPANITNLETHTIQPTPQTHQNITTSYNPVNTTNPQTSKTLPQERFDLFDWASTILSGFFN